MAAVAIGKTEWAFWDLMMAAEIDPKNQEICKKLDEVKSNLQKMKSKSQSQDDVPLGLASGLSLPVKNPGGKLEKNCSVEHDKVPEENNSNLEKSNEEFILGMKEENDDVSQGCSKVKEEITFNELMEVEKEETQDEMKDDTANKSNLEKSIMAEAAEPKYQFVHRKRPGSFLSLSKNDYQLLLKGKTIKYVHSKIGSPVTIRVLNNARDEMGKKEVDCEEKTLENTIYKQAEQNSVARVSMETSKDQIKDIEMGISSFESKKREGENEINDTGITASEHGNISEWGDTKRKKIAQLDMKNVTLNFGVKMTIPLAFPSSQIVTCRYRAGMKRKTAASQSDLDQHPRKKSLFVSCCNSVSNICHCNHNICTNAPGTKLECRESVEVAHELATEAGTE